MANSPTVAAPIQLLQEKVLVNNPKALSKLLSLMRCADRAAQTPQRLRADRALAAPRPAWSSQADATGPRLPPHTRAPRLVHAARSPTSPTRMGASPRGSRASSPSWA